MRHKSPARRAHVTRSHHMLERVVRLPALLVRDSDSAHRPRGNRNGRNPAVSADAQLASAPADGARLANRPARSRSHPGRIHPESRAPKPKNPGFPSRRSRVRGPSSAFARPAGNGRFCLCLRAEGRVTPRLRVNARVNACEPGESLQPIRTPRGRPRGRLVAALLKDCDGFDLDEQVGFAERCDSEEGHGLDEVHFQAAAPWTPAMSAGIISGLHSTRPWHERDTQALVERLDARVVGRGRARIAPGDS